MVIWRITGTEIGPNGNGAAHFATKEEALYAKREYESDEGTSAGNIAGGPDKIIVRNREQLAALLDDTMGYGVS